MNLLRTGIIFLLTISPIIGHAQFRHFPHGHAAEFQYNGAFSKLKFDSTALINQTGFDSTLFLMDYNLEYCSTGYLEMYSKPFSIDNIGFLYDTNRLILRVNGWDVLDIPNSIQPGSKAKSKQGYEVIYLKKDWYEKDGIKDSAAWFYPFKNGGWNIKDEPYILGFNVGWINIPANGVLKQYSPVINGIAQNMPVLKWQDFYPERAGDVKQWGYYYSWYNEKDKPKGRIDSFLSVQVHADSISMIVMSRTLNYDNTWSLPRTSNFSIKPDPRLLKYLDSVNYGNSLLVEKYGEIWHPSLISGKQDSIFHFADRNHGYYIHDSTNCFYNQVADVSITKNWNTWYGYNYYDRYMYSYTTESLVAARVGTHSFGKIQNVGFGHIPKHALNFYPNPASETLYLEDDFNGSMYFIRDLSGKLIQSEILQNGEIHLPNIPAGLYLIQIEKAGISYSGKLQFIQP